MYEINGKRGLHFLMLVSRRALAAVVFSLAPFQPCAQGAAGPSQNPSQSRFCAIVKMAARPNCVIGRCGRAGW